MPSFKSVLVSFTLLAATCAVTPAMAVPTLITFDAGDPIGGLAVGATLANQYAAYGVTFTPNAFTGAGGPTGPWATNTGMQIASTNGSDVGGLGTPPLVSGNLLHSFSNWQNENGDPSFAAWFSGGINSFSADFGGVFDPQNVHLYAYSGSTLLGSVAGTATTGQFKLSISSASLIDRIVITPGTYDDWVGVDNIAFERAAAGPVGVPEPASMALVALGLAGLGFARRRQGK